MQRGLILLMTVLLVGCGEQIEEQSAAPGDTRPADPLVGVWLQPFDGQPGFQGYQFEADGAVRFVNMFSINGDRWERVGADSLRIWSSTLRYPEPEAMTYAIDSVSDRSLVLTWGAGARRAYMRASGPLVGRWREAGGDRLLDITPRRAGYRVMLGTPRGFDSFEAVEEEDGSLRLLGERTIHIRSEGPNRLVVSNGAVFVRSMFLASGRAP